MIKVAITKDYLLKDYTEESFPKEDLIKYGYQEIELDEKYSNCKLEDFDLVNGLYQFNAVKYSARIAEELSEAYGALIEKKIREKYSVSDELSIHRQKEAKPAEWQEYYKYCERCKAEARTELGM